MILSIDIGFADLGFCVVDEEGNIIEVGLCRTKKSRATSVSVDSLSRCRSLASQLREVISRREALSLLRAEAPSYPREASTSTKLGMSWGILMSVLPPDLAVEIITPQNMRKGLGLPRGADKEDLFAKARELHPEALQIIEETYPVKLRQHIIDAICVASIDPEKGLFHEVKTSSPVKGRTPLQLDLEGRRLL